MKATSYEQMAAAPALAAAWRKGRADFEAAAADYSGAGRSRAMDAGGEECLELLDHLVGRFGNPSANHSEGLEDACIFLLEHMAARFREQDSLGVAGATR